MAASPVQFGGLRDEERSLQPHEAWRAGLVLDAAHGMMPVTILIGIG